MFGMEKTEIGMVSCEMNSSHFQMLTQDEEKL